MLKPERSPEHRRLLQELDDRSREANDAIRVIIGMRDKKSPEFQRLREKHKELCGQIDDINRQLQPYDTRFLEDVQHYNQFVKEEEARCAEQAIISLENAKYEKAREKEQATQNAKLSETKRIDAEREREFLTIEAQKQRDHELQMAIIQRDTALAQAEASRLAAEANAKAQEQASNSLDALISGVTENGATKDRQ